VVVGENTEICTRRGRVAEERDADEVATADGSCTGKGWNVASRGVRVRRETHNPGQKLTLVPRPTC